MEEKGTFRIETEDLFGIEIDKGHTGIFDCNGKEFMLGGRVETETGEKGTVVIYYGNYMIELDTKRTRINRLCEVIK